MTIDSCKYRQTFWPKQPISRVLSLQQISLQTGDGHSSRTAVTGGLKQPTRKHGRAVLNASLFGLAPDGVYLASNVTAGSGELLPHPFTLTCLCNAPAGGLLSVALSLGSPPLVIIKRHARWSPDFPPPSRAAAIWSTSAKLKLLVPHHRPILKNQYSLAMRAGDQVIAPEKKVV